MKSVFVTSVERFSGKTAICLALGRHLQTKGFKIGYLKPLSVEPWLIGDKVADEDAAFAIEALGLSTQPWEISPVVLTRDFLCSHIKGQQQYDLIQRIQKANKKAKDGVEIMLYEGGGSLREGYVVDLPVTTIVEALGSDALAVVKYRGHIRLLDDALTAQARLGDRLGGIIINQVPNDVSDFVSKDALPYLEKRGIRIFGVIPETRALTALTLQELSDVLEAELLTSSFNPGAFVETLTVGAMTTEAALSRFRKQTNKAVITGGDRSDIQLAALETSTICLILTGNLQPSPLIIKQAEDLGVAVFLVPGTTMETVESIESIFGKTRLGLSAKLTQFETLFSEHVNTEKLFQAFGF